MTANKPYRAKKALGQNFLKSELALNKIIEAGEVSKEDVILEIGPGKGALTERLLARAGKVVAVEKDRELFEFLKNKFEKEIKAKKLVLVQEDILKFKMVEALKTFSNGLAGVGDPEDRGPEKKFLVPPYKIIANIPYNITGAILKKFLTAPNQPSLMVLMVQQEVAQRIAAKNGKESILSISVKAYGEPKIVMKVGARYFSPPPKVDSAVISIKNISREFFLKNKIQEDYFWEIIKTGFAHKRKKLSSNLRALVPPKKISDAPENARAEDLKLADWLKFI